MSEMRGIRRIKAAISNDPSPGSGFAACRPLPLAGEAKITAAPLPSTITGKSDA